MADEKVVIDTERATLPSKSTPQDAPATVFEHAVDADDALKALEGHGSLK